MGCPTNRQILNREADGWWGGKKEGVGKRGTQQTLIYLRVSQRQKSECTELRMDDLPRYWDWVAELSRHGID